MGLESTAPRVFKKMMTAVQDANGNGNGAVANGVEDVPAATVTKTTTSTNNTKKASSSTSSTTTIKEKEAPVAVDYGSSR